MRTKVTLVLLFLNVALFFFIFKFERQWRTEAASLEARHRVLGPEAADIRSLEVTSKTAGGSFSLVRKQDTWLLSSPLDWPANPHAVRSILDELQLLEDETSFPTKDLAKSNQSLADFGLDQPSATISFTSGALSAGGSVKPTVLRLGATTTGNRLYILSPDGERIHVVNRTHLGSVGLTLDQLRADGLLTIQVFEAQALNIQAGTVDPTRAATTTNVRTSIRLETGRWKFDAPITDRASKTALEDTLNRLRLLRPKAFVPPPAGPAPSAAPTLRVGLEGNNRRETLFLGEPLTPPVENAPAGATTDYYAQIGDRNAVFTVAVPNDLVQILRNAPEKLRERRFLDFTPAAVTAIELREPVQANQPPLILQRLEAPPTDAARETTWQVVRRGDATQGPQTMTADTPAVQRLLDRLARLEAKAENGFVSDNPTSPQLEAWGFNRPDREVVLSFPASGPQPAGAAAPTTTLLLQLGTDRNRNVFARVGSDPRASVYAVTPDILEALPLAPLEWRDRQVLTVPANGRIAAVKLINLATKQILLDTAPDAAGQLTVAGRDIEAAAKLAELLRNVRARRFLEGTPGEKIFVGGTDRDWTYQLDITIALPGGASGNQTTVRTLLLTERVGGTEQYAATREPAAVFQIEQPLLDMLWRLTARDPGPPAETTAPAPRNPNAK